VHAVDVLRGDAGGGEIAARRGDHHVVKAKRYRMGMWWRESAWSVTILLRAVGVAGVAAEPGLLAELSGPGDDHVVGLTGEDRGRVPEGVLVVGREPDRGLQAVEVL
jgi:hypothetical protein